MAEYSTIVAPAQEAQVSYLTSDHLGSPRITTDKNGNVYSRRDFMPFGEEIASPERTAGLNYKADTVRQKFTSYERDNETDLDFAEARMYSSQLGRFTTVDALLASAAPENPQTWNRYIYVGNNPLNIIDPTGLKWYFSSANNDYKWFGDDDVIEVGYDRVTGTDGQAGSFVYQADDGRWYALNPYSHSSADYDTQEAATETARNWYANPNIDTLVGSIAENSETKGRTVRIAAAGAVGVCIGTAGTGCPAAIRIATDVIDAEISTARQNETNSSSNPPGIVDPRPASERITGKLNKSKSYASELAHLNETELRQKSRQKSPEAQKAKKMLKLIKDADRLRAKLKNKGSRGRN